MADPNPNPPTPPAGGAPPPTPTGITQDDLHKAIEKARLEEREKLRTQLETAEASAKEAKELKAKVASMTDQITQLTDKVASLTAGKTASGGVDVEKAIETAVNATVARMEKEYSGQIQALRGELETEKVTRQKLTVEQRRAQMIAAAGDALIPELVTGSNEEELKASIEKSKEIYQRTVAKAGAAPSLPNPNGNPGAPTPAAPPAAPPVAGAANPPGGGAPTPVPGQRMPLGEYAKRREELKKNAAARYPTGALT